jgi:RHS repeat-associated protein
MWHLSQSLPHRRARLQVFNVPIPDRRLYLHKLLLTLCLGLACCSLANAQITEISSSTATPTPGVGHDYISLLSETVNPATGSVSYRLGVPIPPGRGMTLPLAFAYDSSGVNFVVASGGQARFFSSNSGMPKGGWAYTIPSLSSAIVLQIVTPIIPGTSYTCTYFANYVFQDPSGGRHALEAGPIAGTNQQLCTGQTHWFGGDVFYQADLQPSSSLVAGPDGTVFSFPFSPGGFNLPASIEDRNGNKVTITNASSDGGRFNVMDTLGRTLLSSSSFGSTGDTLAVSGLSNVYRLTWGTANANSNSTVTATPLNGTQNDSQCFGISPGFPSNSVLTAISLPNGKQFQFSYDLTYGELSKITYPSGGYISYAWGLSPQSNSIDFPDRSVGPNCQYIYDKPAVLHRYVSFDGSTIALQQDFSYTTTWDLTKSFPHWTAKQTTVTTHDLVRGITYKIIYNYSNIFFSDCNNPYAPAGSCNVDGIPMEQTIVYKDPSGSTMRTVNKTWFAADLLQTQQTTLDNGLTSEVSYAYASGAQIKETDSYDFGTGAPGALLRKTVVNYQSFGVTPIFPQQASIFDRPCQTITYDGNGNRAAETDYFYDNGATTTPCGTAGTPSVAAVGNLISNTHDETNYSASSTAPRGNATTITKQCFPSCANAVTTLTYDETGQTLSSKDANANTTNYSYADNFDSPPSANTNAYVTQITAPSANGVSHIQKFKYAYSDGQLIQSTDENNQVTSYLYADPLRRPTETDLPDGGKTTISYNDAPPSPSVTMSRLMNSSNQFVTSTTTTDGVGHVVKTLLTTDPDCASGDRTDTTYDGFGRVYTVSNPYCIAGESTSGLTTYAYDALGRTTQVTHPDNTIVVTTYTGRATQVQDEGNGTQRVTRISQSDGLGRLSSLCEVAPGPFVGAGGSSSSSLIGSAGSPVACGQDIAGTGFLTTYQYDTLNNLLQVNQTGIAPRTFTYDSLSRLLTASNPESGAISYAYDANGNLLTKTAPAPNQTGTVTVATTYQYDALNRLTQKSYNDGATPTALYFYDVRNLNYGCTASYTNLVGRLSGSAVPGWIFCDGYDVMGRLVDKDLRTPQNQMHVLDDAYDLLGNITTETAGSGSVYYAYNTAGRFLSATSSFSGPQDPANVISGMHYNAFGGLTSATLGDNETETYTYVPTLTRLQSYTAKLGANTLYNFNIGTFAPNGDILAANDTANGNWTYSYDAFNRLAGSNKNSGQSVFSYVYDRFGNRWQQNGPNSFIATFTCNNPGSPQNNNRMDGYSYDAAGNLLNDGAHNYAYDAENRIIQVDAGATATYVYDADGHRVQKTSTVGNTSDPAGTWIYFYDQAGRWVQKFNSPGNTFVQGNIYAGGRHVATVGGGTTFSHSDWLGTERVRTTYAGATCESIASLPFGDGLTTTGNCYHPSPLHFTGKERDAESGLDNFGARYDSSSLGRFMSPDWSAKQEPVPYSKFDNPQTLNLYSYVQNNPLSNVDDNGHATIELRYTPVAVGNHTYIVVTDTNGHQTYYRAGPTNGASAGWITPASSGSSTQGAGSNSSNSSNSTTPGAGPGGAGANTGPFGALTAEHGDYMPGTIDYETHPAASVTLLSNNQPASGYTDQLNQYQNNINQSNIPYNPLSTNSNAYAEGAAKFLGLTPPASPPVLAQGHGTPLPVPPPTPPAPPPPPPSCADKVTGQC